MDPKHSIHGCSANPETALRSPDLLPLQIGLHIASKSDAVLLLLQSLQWLPHLPGKM